jgi:hypothetical protein
VTDAIALGEKLLSLLEESARTTTYKPALLLALIDRVPEYGAEESIPVRALAERVIELYWPQTLTYPTTGNVLRQSQTSAGRAAMSKRSSRFGPSIPRASPSRPTRAELGATPRECRGDTRGVADPAAATALRRISLQLWLGLDRGGRLVGTRIPKRDTHNPTSPGVGDALTALGPLLRPFITRWWTDKAAQLNPEVEAARSVLEFEDFLFGRDRVALERIAEGLLDLQQGTCFYCHTTIGHNREIDHFIPGGVTAATTASTISLPPVTAATTASARPSPDPHTSSISSNATRPGAGTSPRSRPSAGGHGILLEPSGLPAPPTCAPQTSGRSGSAPEPTTRSNASQDIAQSSWLS